MWLLLIFLIIYSYAFIMATTTDSTNLGECQALVSAVTSTHRLPESVSSPGRQKMRRTSTPRREARSSTSKAIP